MPRYFFNHANGVRDLDAEGSDLADLAHARTEAVRYAAAVLKGAPDEIWSGGTWRVEVTDVDGAFLFAIVVLAVETATAPDERPPAINPPDGSGAGSCP